MMRLSVLLAVFLAPLIVRADVEVGQQPVPSWVKPLTIEEDAKSPKGEEPVGVELLLEDRQIRATDVGFDHVRRLAYRIVDQSGLDGASSISLQFDPEHETLAFNFVRLRRDGETIDQLKDSTIDLLRQEMRLGQGVMDGHLTAAIQLTDVRVGDIIDYSYSGSVTTPLWPGEFFDSTNVDVFLPIAQLHYSVATPVVDGIYFRKIATDTDVAITEEDGWRTHSIHLRDLEATDLELDTPDDWFSLGFIQFSTMSEWSQVVDWALPLFDTETSLPTTFTDKLDRIAAESQDPDVRAIRVLRLLQQDIRYLSLAYGLGTHVPRAPATTLERGYGDCKDKSVLLIAALAYLGIDSWPALASLYTGATTPQLLPSINAFDHVVVGIEIGDEILWVDPTASYQGGNASTMVPLDLGWVLPLKDGQSELVELVVPMPDKPIVEIFDKITIPLAGTEPVNVTVEQLYRGLFADAYRASIAQAGKQAITDSFSTYYRNVYDTIEITQEPAIDDNDQANTLRITMAFEITPETMAREKFLDKFPVHAGAVRNILPTSVDKDKTSPLAIPKGIYARHTINLLTPGRILVASPQTSKSTNGIEYSRVFDGQGERMEIEYSLRVSEDSVAPDAFDEVTGIADTIADQSDIVFFVSTAGKTLSGILGREIALDDSEQDSILNAGRLIEDGSFVEAVSTINSLLETYSENEILRGFLLQLKGQALLGLRRPRAAIAAFAEGFELHTPTEGFIYLGYLEALTFVNDSNGLAMNTTRMLDEHPDMLQYVPERLMFSLSGQLRRDGDTLLRDKLLVSIAQASLQIDDDSINTFRSMFRDATLAAARSGDMVLAKRLLEQIKSPRDLSVLLALKEMEELWPAIEEKHGKDLALAVEDYVVFSEQLAKSAPDDFDYQDQHLQALRLAERYDDAIEFAESVLGDWTKVEAIGYEAFWFINLYSITVFDSGDHKKADEILERLLALGLDQNTDLLGMAINRSSQLLEQGEFRRALSTVGELEQLDEDLASDYGWASIYHVKICATFALGEEDAATKVFEESLMPVAHAHDQALAKSLLCMNRLDEAADHLMERLRDPSKAPAAVRVYRSVKSPAKLTPYLNMLRERNEEIKARPNVMAAFDKVGRALTIQGSLWQWYAF